MFEKENFTLIVMALLVKSSVKASVLILMFIVEGWQCKITLDKAGTIAVPETNISEPSEAEPWWGIDDRGAAYALYSRLERRETLKLHFQNLTVFNEGYLRIYHNKRLNPKTWKLFNQTTTNRSLLDFTITNQSAVKIFASARVSFVLSYKNFYCDVPDHIEAENCTNHWSKKSKCSFKCKDPIAELGRRKKMATSVCRRSQRWSRNLDKLCKPHSRKVEPELDLEKLQEIAESRGNQGGLFDLDVEIEGRSFVRRKINCYVFCLRSRSTRSYFFPCSYDKLSAHQERFCLRCRAITCRANLAVFA